MGMSRWGGTAALAALVMSAWVATNVDAAVLCARKGKIKIRPEACKPKETLVHDLAQVEARFADAFEARCRAEPSRQLASSPPSFLYASDYCDGGCRVHDADPAACASAFQLTWRGASACVYLDGRCLPCLECGEPAGRCIDACQPVACADATRTHFVGSGGANDTCGQLTTEETCNGAWALDYGRRPSACYWDLGACLQCGTDAEGNGSCTNPCRAPGACADPARSLASYCGIHNGDEPACNASWSYGGGSSRSYSCFYRASTGECRGCTAIELLRGSCTEACNPGAAW